MFYRCETSIGSTLLVHRHGLVDPPLSSQRPPPVKQDVRVGRAHLCLSQRPAIVIVAHVPVGGHAAALPVPYEGCVVPVPHAAHVVRHREEVVQRRHGPTPLECLPWHPGTRGRDEMNTTWDLCGVSYCCCC